jgi:hypothetical protein
MKYKSAKLTFLDHYKYRLKINDLVPYGASESVTSSLATETLLTKMITGVVSLEVPYTSDTVILQPRPRSFVHRAPNA